MNNIRILKAKLNKNLLVTNIGYIETLEDKSTTEHDNVKCDWIAHQDLIDAFNALVPHFVLLNQTPDQNKIEDLDSPPELPDYKVTSFTIAGEDDHEGFMLSGTRKLSTGKVQPLNTPFYKWEDSQPYEFTSEIGEQLDTVQNEVRLYLGGKRAPSRQTSMEFPGDVHEDDLDMDDEGVRVTTEKVKK